MQDDAGRSPETNETTLRDSAERAVMTDGSPSHLFAYGTLMKESVWRAVVGEPLVCAPARLYGYRRLCVPGAAYPGICESDSREFVDGVLWYSVDGIILSRTDAFEDEGEEYYRIAESVYEEDGRTRRAWVYVYSRPWLLPDVPWLDSSGAEC